MSRTFHIPASYASPGTGALRCTGDAAFYLRAFPNLRVIDVRGQVQRASPEGDVDILLGCDAGGITRDDAGRLIE
ncbi:MAG: hypothetical protein ACYDGM_14040 [Vulcanimicrobiaceae bacterium]